MMIVTKLEMILFFGIFCPLLYPLIIVSLNSFLYFYQYTINKLKWKIIFTNYHNGIKSFPFNYLFFGIICQQILSVLFLKSNIFMDIINHLYNY